MQPIEVDGRQGETQRVDEDPQQIDYVVAVRRLNKRARWSRRCAFYVIGQRAGDERRPQIDGDGREPDHRDAEKDAVRCVKQTRADVAAELDEFLRRTKPKKEIVKKKWR